MTFVLRPRRLVSEGASLSLGELSGAWTLCRVPVTMADRDWGECPGWPLSAELTLVGVSRSAFGHSRLSSPSPEAQDKP